MKRTLTNAPVIPEGWMPRPHTTAYNFLDWLANYQQWLILIKQVKLSKVDVQNEN